MRSKSVRTTALILGIALLLVAALSSLATAEPRHLLVTLLGGKQVSITVDAAPGTAASSIPLPDLGGPVVSVAEIGAPPAPAPATTAPPTTAATTVTGPPTTIAPTTGTTPTTTATGPAAVGGIVKPKGQPKGEGRDSAAVAPTTTQSGSQPTLEDANGSTTPTDPADGAAPTPATPGFTVAPSGPAIVGVPNFFIDNFRIPPFLLPIYQAAGIQYSVPWQVLAAINEIETDYGRNLSVSSAGALGWMQFMPPSWAMYGVDANGDGVKDPYNPVDAIFAAARYLKAAGADTDLSQAIFAYNHADWYVESVLLRARVIGGMPADLVGSLTGLTQGHFPVAARATYADGLNAKAATQRVQGANAAVPVEGDPSRRSINVFARAGAPVIAVNDGRVVKLGENARLGRFVVLQDVYGNRYTYSHLGSLASKYPVPKPHAQDATAGNELELPKTDAKPTVPATTGAQKPEDKPSGTDTDGGGKDRVAANASDAAAGATDAPAATKERLFAHPERPAAYAAGGQRQLAELGQPLESFDGYFTQALALDPHDYLLKPLQRGSSVIAGTILGRIGKTDPALAPHVEFAIRPAGRGAPQIDPKPILDGWKLLESTAIYRAKGKNAFAAANANGPSIGQIMLMSKEQLQRSVLADPRLTIYECGRQDVATGAIDRRVLATLEFLSANGLRLTVTALECGHGYYTTSGNVSEHSSGNAVDIAAVNGIPIAGHQGSGSITDITIRRLLTLQGTMKPHQIISLMTYPGTDNTLALPDHADHIHVGFHPVGDLLGGQKLQAILKPQQWTKLVEQLGSIENPVVPTHASKYAIKDGRGD